MLFRKIDMKQLFFFYWKHLRVLSLICGIDFLVKWNIWKIEIIKLAKLYSQRDLNSLKKNTVNKYTFRCFSWGIGSQFLICLFHILHHETHVVLTKWKYLMYCFYYIGISRWYFSKIPEVLGERWQMP